jgi:hypothetical protein
MATNFTYNSKEAKKMREDAKKRAEERANKGKEKYKPTDTKIGPNMNQVNKLDGNKATTKATTKAPIVTKKQLEDSGFTNLRDYLNNKKGLTRRDSKAPERTNNKPESTTKSQDAKPNKSNAPKPDYSNKTKAKTSMMDKFKSLVGADREPTAKEAMGRNQMNAARKSMGFEKGGKVKGKGLIFEDRDVYKKRAEKDAPALKRMLEEKPKRPPEAAAYKGMNKAPASMSRAGVAKMPGMKKGGNVKKYKKGGSIDGCAVRGHTRAKRSR